MPSRVSPPPPGAPTRSEPSQVFKRLLDEVRRASTTPPGLQRKPPAIPPVSKQTSPAPKPGSVAASGKAVAAAPVHSQVAVARTRVDAEAKRLGDVRAHHVATAEQASTVRAELTDGADQQRSNRLVDLIVKELVTEFETRPGGAASQKIGNPVQPISALNELPFGVGAQPPKAPTPGPEVRAAQAAALIERIEVFVKSQRPALALTLNNSLGARVEIEKLGPGRIALRLVGQNGPPAPATVNRIREELQARGLKVGALSVS